MIVLLPEYIVSLQACNQPQVQLGLLVKYSLKQIKLTL
jgi:hypothetical protein